jgi:hypothetical protein
LNALGRIPSIKRAKECKGKRKVKQGRMWLVAEEECVLWRNQYDWDHEEEIMHEKLRVEEEAGFREEDEEGTEEEDVKEEETGEESEG